MSNIKIVTDSSVGLIDAEVKENNINIIPLSVMINDSIYVEGESITNDEFEEKMETSKTLPKTSQPPIGTFVEMFDKLGSDGSQVLSLNMTDQISGTVHTAEQAAQMSQSDVTVVDTRSTDRGMAFQVLAAAKLANAGASMNDILTKIAEIRENSTLYMAVMTLDNLVKGGRISRLTGVLSSVLNMKIILEMIDGELKIKNKGRGMKTVNKFVSDLVEELKTTPHVKSIGISHAGNEKKAFEVRDLLQAAVPTIDILVRQTAPIIATHGGPGAFAVMFYVDKD
ncbi:DegV family protein [Dellaglioa sp. BT-FLS60]